MPGIFLMHPLEFSPVLQDRLDVYHFFSQTLPKFPRGMDLYQISLSKNSQIVIEFSQIQYLPYEFITFSRFYMHKIFFHISLRPNQQYKKHDCKVVFFTSSMEKSFPNHMHLPARHPLLVRHLLRTIYQKY